VSDIPVPDATATYLAVAAGNFYEADLAFWTLKAALGDREPTHPEAAHLDVLRRRRKDYYADLVIWVTTCEGERAILAAREGGDTWNSSPSSSASAPAASARPGYSF
jgi:hypothetical protein